MLTCLFILKCYLVAGAYFASLWAVWEGLPNVTGWKHLPWFVQALLWTGLGWPLVLYVIVESRFERRAP